VDFGSTSPSQFKARLASGAAAGVSGAIQVRLDSTGGTKIAEIDFGNNGGWQNWQTIPANVVASATGVHDVYLVFSGSTSDFTNVNWFTFTR
jgi:hypothetical protein